MVIFVFYSKSTRGKREKITTFDDTGTAPFVFRIRVHVY